MIEKYHWTLSISKATYGAFKLRQIKKERTRKTLINIF